MINSGAINESISKDKFKQQVLSDYRLAYESRQASLLGRKEVLTGKAKFGIFGDGKEIPQIVLAKFFEKGDFRSGYYRDQTFMFATGMRTIKEFFAQLYANTEPNADPSSGGRSMNSHFATRLLDENGNWLTQTENFNSTSDISPTASQMPRLLGLAYASKLYRQNEKLHNLKDFSISGNEIAFGTIGDASTSEGMFWEVINAGGVLQVPLLISIWDDQYGISVPAKYQTTKENLSAILEGFKTDENGKGYHLYRVKGWDYPSLIKTYKQAVEECRKDHIPCIVHVVELTQPQGHSTSGSHERYKSKERLDWEKEFDCILQMRNWIEKTGLADANEIDDIEKSAIEVVKNIQATAWTEYLQPIKNERDETIAVLNKIATESTKNTEITNIANKLSSIDIPERRDIYSAIFETLQITITEKNEKRNELLNLYKNFEKANFSKYNSNLYSSSHNSLLKVDEIKPIYSENSKTMDGYKILQTFFDKAFERDNRIIAFGEDVGNIGDVNQGFAGLQVKYGENRISDTAIRELSIVGQAIGLALRGLRPIAEIQYLDYFLYAIQIVSDDLATLHYRTAAGQKAPVIIRTRGHRLEGIWHSGSPMGMILNAIRGVHVLVPRNMTQAVGFYNALLKCDEPALLIEPLNGYRIKEKLPDNFGEFTLKPGTPEILINGNDITLVTYGSCCRIASEACKKLEKSGISVELIDIQSLLPFDINNTIVESVKKTNKLAILDEDVPGGASAFILQQILEKQHGFNYLDAEPLTISAQEHRPAYGSDGDYFSKPNVETVFEKIYDLMHNYNPSVYPSLF
ncbi:MAG: transketolase [Bacteroidetes bacterium]|nr:transketolase [Bacteroidota bacterium]